MCVFVFASGCRIQIGYAAETIVLFRNGASQDVVDLLVTNKSSHNIRELTVIYPHSIPGYSSAKRRAGKPIFEDATATLRRKGHPLNRFYEGPGGHLWTGKEEVEGAVRRFPGVVMPEKGFPLAIEQSDPQAPHHDPILYTGNTRGRHTISNRLLDDDQRIVLDQLEFSAYSCQFEHPLEPNESRWIRWRIGPLGSCINPMSWLTRALRLMADRLIFQYIIMGPALVRERFAEMIELYIDEADKEKGPEADRLFTAAVGTSAKMIENGYDAPDTTVEILDWRINLFPGRCGRLARIEPPEGHIRKCGSLPNMVGIADYRHPNELCYQWKAGWRNTGAENGGDIEGYFKVDLESRVTSLLVPWVPWLALGIGGWQLWNVYGATWLTTLIQQLSKYFR